MKIKIYFLWNVVPKEINFYYDAFQKKTFRRISGAPGRTSKPLEGLLGLLEGVLGP